ncbi:hypothetical protein ACA29_06135 [Lederbergia galactosidilytica]|uniref:Uncharacterized protein n=1 Tax=Lederbergia galactosidilytica TaxID=217031 RepID=A0A0Q9Y9I2_9BACI|nr:hypothetical protein ACA29_06135 [Lederbergia galactosidilytica]
MKEWNRHQHQCILQKRHGEKWTGQERNTLLVIQEALKRYGCMRHPFLLFWLPPLCSQPPKGQGFASPTLTQFFQKVQGKMVHLFVKVGEDTGFSDPPQGSGMNSEAGPVVVESEVVSLQMDLQEAQRETTFPILVPTYIPKAYHFENVTVMKGEQELSREIYLHYEGDDGGFLIDQQVAG